MIRYYNNLFDFATFNANVQHIMEKSVYNLKIQDQVCHTTPNYVQNLVDEKPSCGQLYIYDDITAMEQRLKNNKDLTKEHIITLQRVMNNNPYAKNYKYLHQVANIKNIPNYRLYFIRKNDEHKHRYNKPLTSQCGAIIVSKSGISNNFDLCIYPKFEDADYKISYLNKLSHHVDPMVFPLLFPSGDLGWSTGYTKKSDSRKYDTMTLLQFY